MFTKQVNLSDVERHTLVVRKHWKGLQKGQRVKIEHFLDGQLITRRRIAGHKKINEVAIQNAFKQKRLAVLCHG